MPILRPARAALLVATLVASPAGVARAADDAPSAAAQSAAETLFTEARALLQAGRREEACKKFDESYRIDPAMGTLFNVALCNERAGRLATAWLQFREVASRSRTARPDRAALADARANELGPRLSRLRIVVSDAERRLPGYSIELDGQPVPLTTLATPLPVDGGEHTLIARAADRAPATVKFSVEPERGVREASIPALVVQRAAPTPAPPTERVAPPPATSPSRPTLAWVLGAAGVASLAVGGGFGISVLSQTSEVKDEQKSFNDREAKYKQLDTQAYISDVGLALGAVLVGTAAVLFITAPASTGTPPKAGGFTLTPKGVLF